MGYRDISHLYINERWLNSLDKNEIAVDELNKGIQIAIKKAISPYQNQFMNGLIVSTGTDEGYKVSINSIVYDNILSIGELTLAANDTVVIVAPNGETNNMFILGKLG